MGVSDDADIVATPSTGPQILALRTSTEGTVWKDMSITYRPIDPEKWYYIRAEGSGGDVRLTQTGAFLLLSDGLALAVNGVAVAAVTPIGEIEAEYLYEFSGATLLGT